MSRAEELLDWLRTPRATRWFTEEPVAERDIRSICEVARWTGSARNRQPWRLRVATEPDLRRRLSTLGDYALHLANAPAVLAIAVDPELGGRDTPFDEGRLCQSIVLAAHALGLGSCPVTLHPEQNVAAAGRLLGLTARWQVRHVVALGHPAPRPPGVSAIPTGRLAASALLGEDHAG
ncbi:nitroreductase family protein [Actinoalloteichus spitiensis]|uniref:nitroreductase family protein n=1 Tax=Actinoalloteichus spitiensis TaxID=252394 RepID=UPI001FDFDE42|nr:nitroreductase family protein [Actinoalloteichus spitiensis]